jgi:hypothetical protein
VKKKKSMQNIELEAINLAEAFNSCFRKYGYPLFKRHTLKDSKWWQYFFRAADMYSNLPDWNAYIWVACQFEKHGKRWPTQMSGQEAFDTFQEYKHRFINEENPDHAVARKLMNTQKYIMDWSVRTGSDMSLFLDDRLNLFALQRRMVDPSYFTVSKKYRRLDEKVKYEIMNIEEYMVRRASVLRNDRIKNKMKELLGEDYG